MKKRLSSVLALAMASTMLLAACGGGSSNSGSSSADTSSASSTSEATADAGSGDLTEWEESSQIYATDETDDELYELAKAEGKVTVYSISSRITKVEEAFEAAYPGIDVEVFDIKTNELLEKVTKEYDAGQHVADVVHIKDEDGTIWNEYVQDKILYNYKPADILSHIDPIYTETATPLYIELTQLFYNEEDYPDGSPITNIWQVTDKEWEGRVMMQNPLNNISWGSWITGFTLGDAPEKLEAAYKELYGEDLVLSDGCENAGYEFLKRLIDNKPVYAQSSDEAAEAVGTRGQNGKAPIGFSASSKVRKNKDNDWCLVPVNLYPTNGIPLANTLYVVEGSEHPYAAKLLTRFMMGGADGTSEGYAPFNSEGGWPVRDDIAGNEKSIPFSELMLSNPSKEDMYNNVYKVRDFWQINDKR